MGIRKDFGKLKDALNVPDLIEIQLNSYSEFLQLETKPLKRKKRGLQAVLSEAFPIESYDGQISLDFVSYFKYFILTKF